MPKDRKTQGGQPRELGATADEGSLGGPSLFDIAEILYVPRRMTMERLHDVMRNMDDKLNPPDEPEEEGEAFYSCNCGERCRC